MATTNQSQGAAQAGPEDRLMLPKPLPMLAVPAEPFDSPEYCFECKWDGIRVLAAVEQGGWQLWGREQADYTGRYPELDVLRRLPAETLLDGELVVFDPDGRPDLPRLLRRPNVEATLPQDHAVRPGPSRSGRTWTPWSMSCSCSGIEEQPDFVSRDSWGDLVSPVGGAAPVQTSTLFPRGPDMNTLTYFGPSDNPDARRTNSKGRPAQRRKTPSRRHRRVFRCRTRKVPSGARWL